MDEAIENIKKKKQQIPVRQKKSANSDDKWNEKFYSFIWKCISLFAYLCVWVEMKIIPK